MTSNVPTPKVIQRNKKNMLPGHLCQLNSLTLLKIHLISLSFSLKFLLFTIADVPSSKFCSHILKKMYLDYLNHLDAKKLQLSVLYSF
jgi:hypothetical protein